MHHTFYLFFLRMPSVVRILLIVLMFILLFGISIHFIEPENFPTIFDGIWWAIITSSTVGYGDFVPHTVLGRIVGIILIFVGAGFISMYFFSLASSAISKHSHLIEGKLTFRGDDHLIIIGWNERTKNIAESLFDTLDFRCIVLIDETLQENPMPHRKVHFIQGRPPKDEILIKAGIQSAKKVLITADQHKDEHQADMSSILTLITVKGLNPKVPCLIEILTVDQVANAKRAGANIIIETNQIVSKYILTSIQEVFSTK